MIRLIAAIDRKRGIAKKGVIPWSIPDDQAFFTQTTKLYGGNILSGMGTFKTYKEPLVERHNFVLTHGTEPIEGVSLVNDLSSFLSRFKTQDLWVAGGSQVFALVMELGYADELYLTHVDADFDCNHFFPEYSNTFDLIGKQPSQEQNGFHFTYARYSKKV